MTIQLVDPNLIDPNPYQPPTRLTFTPNQLADLESVKALGCLQTPRARPLAGGRFQIVYGWRRRCAWLLYRPGEPMPLDVVDATDEQLFDQAAIENGQRADLSAIEKAVIVQHAIADFNKTQLAAGQLVGLSSQGAVSNLLRLLKLPEAVRDLVRTGDLPERLARQLVPLTTFPVEKQLERIAHAIAKAPASEREKIAENEISALIRQYCKRLHFDGWAKEWNPGSAALIDGNSEILPACSACPLYIIIHDGAHCGRPACYDAKQHAWTQRELERLSQKLGIPIAGDGDKAVKLVIDYNNDDRAKELLRSKSRAELFRLMPNDDGKRNYYHEQVLGSNAVVLAAFDQKLLDRKAAQPVPPKTADETPAKKAVREAAEERERDKRRSEKAALRKAKADIFWLISHTAEAVAPMMLISGGILEFAQDVIDHRFYSQFNDWPEMKVHTNDLERKVTEAKGEPRELLLRRQIVVSEANRELNAFRPEKQFSWPRALGKVEHLIAKTFKLPLPAGWDQPPIHHTPVNCWTCGTFTSMDHITKIDEAAGWQTAADGRVTCSDKCRDVEARHSPSPRKTGSRRSRK